MTRKVGILTAGGDSPGLNAAIRGVGKSVQGHYGMELIGFRDGFRGLMENRSMRLDGEQLSGILTQGGTILGTSRDKPHRMLVNGKPTDMTETIVRNYRQHRLDVLICLGGGGTQKNALRLKQQGLNIITLPKTIDNDVAGTDTSFGFDTALGIATEAIDRLHSTAHSHHRVIVVEIMGHRAGWLALGAGIAGGADVILLPEIPYDIRRVAEAIRQRARNGKRFSIVAVAEGARSLQQVARFRAIQKRKKKASNKHDKQRAREKLAALEADHLGNHTVRLSEQLEQLTGLESRVTILGHVQRGGSPSTADRLLATRLGSACADLIQQKCYGVMVAAAGEAAVPVPLEEVAGVKKLVPLDHPWILSARRVGTSLGD
ncbi:6-phosphofructokinase [Sedimenticola thiotaurini]|uniref:ATP-dependent 6-phosphofructokinase n=1 Tax=Sedimenticola thiotaurini TaxID=1543721 RepID=A0A0F7K0I0_9GAMM|nr:ATP-dependent 6-phosphofructokinase [Sedimenticola thiotaurini]AKH21079.1 6-phosphofructokinase [Sedimenticola thiotaurini]